MRRGRVSVAGAGAHGAVPVDEPSGKRRLLRAASNPIGLLALPAILYLVAFYVVPLVLIVSTSLTDPSTGFANYVDALTGVNARTLLRTVWLGLLGTAITVVIGYPVAYLMVTSSRRVQLLLFVGVLAPYMTSVLVRTFAWQVLLGRLGPVPTTLRALGFDVDSLLQTWAGLLIGLVQVVLPLFILPLVAVMRQVDRSALQAARSQGAGPAETFWRVFVPQTLPGVEVGVVLAFVSVIGSFVLPVLLGGQSATMTGAVIEDRLNNQGLWGQASAMAIVLTALIFLAIGLYRWSTRRRRRWLAARAGQGPSGAYSERRASTVGRAVIRAVRLLDRTRISHYRWPLIVFVVLVQVYLVVPQLVAIPVSFSGTRTLVFPPNGLSLDWYREFSTPEWTDPTLTSFIVAPICAVLATLLGGLAGVGIERAGPRRWAQWSTGLMLAPMIVPIVVAAVGFYLVLFRLRLLDTVPGLVLVETSLAIPFAFAVIRASMQSLDPVYERAAESLGARRIVVLRRVVLPLVAPAIVVALLFSFLLVFDEVVAPIFVTTVDTTVLPKQMYSAVVFSTNPTVAVVGTLSLVLSSLILAASLFLERRSRTGTLEGLAVASGGDERR